jgi:hypothetical protein
MAWQIFHHYRLDFEYRCSVDCIQFRHLEPHTIDRQNAANRTPDAIGAVLAALRKDADSRPLRIIARMASSSDDF